MRTAALLALCLAACSSAPRETTAPATADAYQATIHWTDHGIPHIVADDLGSLMFGQGYAFARGHACILAEQIVRVRSERARWFGPGEREEHIDSDFGFLALGLYDRARRIWPTLSPDASMVVRGWVAGYNHYLADAGPDGLPEPCRGARWVRPLDEVDLVAYGLHLAMLGTGGVFTESIGAARPAAGSGSRLRRGPLPASNGWAIGAERSATGRGMLLANPHFPWEGAHKFYESHLILEGELNAYGASLLGAPLINIGFHGELAWTHTFSASRRIAIFRLDLVEGSPTRYRFGDEARRMEARTFSIRVRRAGGELAEVERTLYRSHHGPIVSGGPLDWTAEHAFALADLSFGRSTIVDQYLGFLRARDLDAFRDALARYHATPYVNTLAADREGNAYYADGSLVPDLGPGALATWKAARSGVPEVRRAWERGIIGLDGSMPLFEVRGVVPLSESPALRRRDFVANANGSYWATNPLEPLSGYSPFFGEVETELSPRTRMNLALLTGRGPGTLSGADGRFDLAELEAAVLGNRVFTAELLRDRVVARCRRRAALADACDALARWDGRVDLGSRGAGLWRDFIASAPSPLYAEPFDPARPVATPRGLAPAPEGRPDPVLEALATAGERLRAAGFAPDAPLGEIQYTEKDGRRIAIHGGIGAEGVLNVARFSPGRARTTFDEMERGALIGRESGLTDRGYPVNYGTSFLLLVTYTDRGPEARAIMTYSASSDPSSPHFADQTEMWSRERLRPVIYDPEEVRRRAVETQNLYCAPRVRNPSSCS